MSDMRTTFLTDTAQLLTPLELAHRLKVSVQTVYRERADGHLPARLVRGKMRFYWPEILKALPEAPTTTVTYGGPRPVDLVQQLKREVQLAKRRIS
jgi:excisionase family DNA binding protein